MQTNQRSNRGFTLIELMITVAVIGILAAIAMPSYNKYILRSHRLEAKNALLSLAQRLEQNYTLSGSYNAKQDGSAVNDAYLTATGLASVPAGSTARYKLSFVAGQPTATTFTLQAVPQSPQTADTECGTLLLNQQNLKGAKGTLDNRAQATLDCWGR